MNKEMPPKKKPYQKPEIKIIDLVADEVLAIGCKTPTTVTVASSGPGPGCLAQNCSNNGS
jgi:hypothetical protein